MRWGCLPTEARLRLQPDLFCIVHLPLSVPFEETSNTDQPVALAVLFDPIVFHLSGQHTTIVPFD